VFIRLPRRSRAKAGDRRNAFRAKWHSALIERRYSAPKAQHFISAWGNAPGLVEPRNASAESATHFRHGFVRI
jgi:hypothetical protein